MSKVEQVERVVEAIEAFVQAKVYYARAYGTATAIDVDETREHLTEKLFELAGVYNV